jgi:transposase-like protein
VVKVVAVLDYSSMSLWYKWAFERLGLECRHERFGLRNRVERFFRYL